MAIQWLDTFIDIAPATLSSWEDKDLSSYIPATASGVLVRVHNTDIYSGHTWGCRPKGSTDDPLPLSGSDLINCPIGVDANRVVQLYRNHTAIEMELVGYFESRNATFFTNRLTRNPPSNETWCDLDLSDDVGSDPAIGALFIIDGTADANSCGLRMKGSTDDRTARPFGSAGAIIGLDGNKICQNYRRGFDVQFYLVGYIKSGAYFYTNAVDYSLSTTGSWTSLPSPLPPDASGGFFEVLGAFEHYYGLRKKGSADTRTGEAHFHQWYCAECDRAGGIEGYRSGTSIEFYLVGYALKESGFPAVHSGHIGSPLIF